MSEKSSPIALLLAEAYYPSTFAGAHRPAKFAKYLARYGWTPIVVCADWNAENSTGCFDPSLGPQADVCETVRFPHMGVGSNVLERGLLKLERILDPYSTPHFGALAMRRLAEKVILSREIQVVWSTYSPGFPHRVASWLARRHGLPWVADFRDLPDQTNRNLREKRLVWDERRACVPASALTAPSRQLADKLAARHRAPVHVIPNGFDEDDYPAETEARSDRFTIAYFGILYAFRDPRPLFAALDLLAAEGSIDLRTMCVAFYGTPADQVSALSCSFACSAIVEARPRVGRAQMLRIACSSTVLLNMQGPAAGGAVPSKLTEYLGARRPILNIPGDKGPGDKLVRETKAGVTAESVKDIALAIGRWYEEWKFDGVVRCRTDRAKAEEFSRRRQTERLAEIFRIVTADHARVQSDEAVSGFV